MFQVKIILLTGRLGQLLTKNPILIGLASNVKECKTTAYQASSLLYVALFGKPELFILRIVSVLKPTNY